MLNVAHRGTADGVHGFNGVGREQGLGEAGGNVQLADGERFLQAFPERAGRSRAPGWRGLWDTILSAGARAS